MIASAIVMGRALAPIEVALANWKQFVAAREGIGRLRAILKVTAGAGRAEGHPATAPPQPDGRGSQRRRARNAKDGRIQRVIRAESRNWVGASRCQRCRKIFAREGSGWASGRPRRARCASTARQSIVGVPTISGGTSDTLPQDVSLFDGTVATNIARFDDAATSEAILEAARVSGAHEMILRLPDGYDTRIGERGTSLSAGQRQRIGLARAVFGRPFLIVLDEPNANLDADGENALVSAIETLRNEQSIVIVISHRPNALAALNMTMVIHGGEAIAFGPREEVFARVARSAVRAELLRTRAIGSPA